MGRTAGAGALAAAALLGLLCLSSGLEGSSSGSEAQITAQEGNPTRATVGGTASGGRRQAAEAAPDDSVRCRLSGICDSPQLAACNATSQAGPGSAGGAGVQPGDSLGCLSTDEERAAAVREAARHAWSGYRDCAWGEDELRPLSCSGMHWLNLSLTLVDSLDTLYLLGMRREFEEAAGWLVDHVDVGAPSEVNLFETTIRVLGGLLSAQALSASSHPQLSRRLADKAAELGARLMPAFRSPSGVPYSDVNLRTGEASPPKWGHISSLSEMCSVSLEFTYLARITGHMPFEEVPLAVHDRLEHHASDGGGLLGQYFDPLTGKANKDHGGTITLGARSDSYYEYLLKQWLLTGKSEGWLIERYVQAMQSVRSRLLKRTAPVGRPGLWYIAEQLKDGQLSGKMDHLVCFLPGLLALADYHNVSTRHSDAYAVNGSAAAGAVAATTAWQKLQRQVQRAREPVAGGAAGTSATSTSASTTSTSSSNNADSNSSSSSEEMPDLQVAHELALTCYEMYRRTPAGLAPEIVHFANNTELQDFPNKHVHDVGHGDFSIKPNDAHNLLRPESVESFYLLWKVTGDPLYKQWAWQVFRAFEKWTKVRPDDRQPLCSACMLEAAYEAAKAAKEQVAAEEAAKAEAAKAEAAQGTDGGAHSSGSENGRGSGGTAAAGASEEAAVKRRQHERAAAAAAEVLQRRLQGGEVCAACSDTGGYTSLESVLAVPPLRRDKMESFFLAETLKYLYLIFVEPPDRCLHPSCQRGPAAGAGEQGQAEEGVGGEEGPGGPLAQEHQAGEPDSSSDSSSSSSGGSSSNDSGGIDNGSAAEHRQQQQQVRRRLLPLDRFVFTTEAHPLPVVGSNSRSNVARVLEPDSPLLRPFAAAQAGAQGGAHCDPDSCASSSSSEPARAAAAGAAARAQQQGGLASGDASTLQALEAVMQDMLHRLADAAAAALSGQGEQAEGEGGAAAGGGGTAPAGGAADAAMCSTEAAAAAAAADGEGQCSGGAGGGQQQGVPPGGDEGEEEDPYEDEEEEGAEQEEDPYEDEEEGEAEEEDDPYEDEEEEGADEGRRRVPATAAAATSRDPAEL